MKPSLCEFCLHMKEVISAKGARFVLCQKSSVENDSPNQAGGKWHDLFGRGRCCINGFGYFAEHAKLKGFTDHQSSLN